MLSSSYPDFRGTSGVASGVASGITSASKDIIGTHQVTTLTIVLQGDALDHLDQQMVKSHCTSNQHASPHPLKLCDVNPSDVLLLLEVQTTTRPMKQAIPSTSIGPNNFPFAPSAQVLPVSLLTNRE